MEPTYYITVTENGSIVEHGPFYVYAHAYKYAILNGLHLVDPNGWDIKKVIAESDDMPGVRHEAMVERILDNGYSGG